MKTKSILLNGGAIGDVAGHGSFIACEFLASAQSDMNPPQYSTPAERAETQQLNEQNLNEH